MLAYIGRRALLAIFTVWAISVLSFAIIQLPPGDYVTSYIAQMASMGSVVTDEEAQNLRIQYGLGQPIYVQYLKWMKLVVQGNFGMSMEWRRPVTEVIGERLWLTVVVSVAALILTWVLALPIGIYSAVRQYSVGDYVATFIGFIGLAVPNFLLALVLLYLGFVLLQRAHRRAVLAGAAGRAVEPGAGVGPRSSTCRSRPLILGLAGTAQQIRIMRANLLDELRKPYVVTARSKGLSGAPRDLEVPGAGGAQSRSRARSATRCPYIVSGSIIVSLVLGLPTVGPLLLKALIAQDMFLAGTIVLLLGVMTVIGTLDLGHPARLDRSAHPARGHVMAEPELVLDPARAPVHGPGAAAAPEQRIFVASQWQLMWWRFRKHKVAVASAVVVFGFYLIVARRGLPRVRRPQRVRGAALAHAAAARLLVRRRALRPARVRAQGRARSPDLQARLSRGSDREDPDPVLRRGLRVPLLRA